MPDVQADIPIVPDLVSGNIPVKDLDCLANAETAGIVTTAAVPLALTSRGDTVAQRRASAALVCHGVRLRQAGGRIHG